MHKPKKVLIAPLNWGLGHVTRCIPIIDEIRRQGAEVLLASDGIALSLLRKEYPDLVCYELPAYQIRYPFDNMVASMVLQMPKILRGAINEYFWLKDFLKNQSVDIVISDNRFGLYNKQVKSVFMTHQLNILAPLSWAVNRVNQYCINQFDECWIPDFEGEPNLAGILSHGGIANRLTVRYLDSLSRMRYMNVTRKYKAIFVLSGPEPQRTILEQKIISQMKKMPDTGNVSYALVRGLPQDKKTEIECPNFEIFNYLTSVDLNKKILESDMMIARSGYSTIMDLVNLRTKAILIPTPGQTEQEYLAQNLMQQSIFLSQTQAELNIEEAMENVKNYTGFKNMNAENDTLKERIAELLKF